MPEKAIKPIPHASIQALVSRYDPELDRIVAVSSDSPLPVETGSGADVAIRASDSPSIDAFGRWRASFPFALFDTKLNHTSESEFWDDQQTSGSGTTSTHSVNRASVTMSVSNATAGKRIRQTFARPNYQPGKSQLVLLTGIIGDNETGIIREIGAHDDENGLFFRNDGGTIKVVRKTNVTGTPVDNEVPQSLWNLDGMGHPDNAKNPSGITVDWTKEQIFVIDFEWLGVGRVRFALDIGGNLYYIHEMVHANILDSVYMSTPNNPLRYSIENDGTGPAASMEQICSTVLSEGGQEGTGVDYWYSTNGTHVDANVADTIYALVGVSLQDGHKGEPVQMKEVSVLTQTNDDFEWLLFRNPTVAGTFNYVAATTGPFEVARGATANVVTPTSDPIAGGFGHGGT